MTCIHYSPEFITARMREREAGNEPPCPHCRLAEAERLLKEVREDAPHFGMPTDRIDGYLVHGYIRPADSAEPTLSKAHKPDDGALESHDVVGKSISSGFPDGER